MDKIFINIAAYRDPLLIRTLTQALENADSPESLVFALGMQYEPEIYPDLSFIPPNQLRVINYDIPKRPGLTRIRYQINQSAYAGEKYFLMIDSHTIFQQGWDTWLKESLTSLGDKCVISGLGEIHDDKLSVASFQIVQGYRDLVFGRKESFHDIDPNEHGKFIKTYYIACGFMFTYGRFIDEVGFDEFSQFEGEEPYLSWKTFMSGWDVFHTTKWLVSHQPDEYFDIAWGGAENRVYVRPDVESVLLHFMIAQKGLAYIYNDYSIYAIKNAVRKPKDWLLSIGYTESDYQKILAHYDSFIHNNIREHDIIML